MMLPVHSFHLKVYQRSLPIHGTQKAYAPNLTSRKQSGQFSYSTCRSPLSSAVFGTRHVQILVKSERKLTKYHVALAKLKGNDEPENKNRKIYTHENTLDEVAQNSRNNFNNEKSDMGILESDTCSEAEEPNCPSSHNQGLSEYPGNHQVSLLDKLKAVHLHVLASEQWNASRIKLCQRAYLESATNLIHYLALQSLDIEQFKEELSSIGLLNLECVNSHVLASINSGIQFLETLMFNNLNNKENAYHVYKRDIISMGEGGKREELSITAMRNMSSFHGTALFGPVQNRKTAHIMVTVGKEAISNEMLITDLLKEGANVIRINCAHDEPGVWSEIIRIAKQSSQMLEKPCRILMDLAGPKLRTGPFEAGPNVMKISPKKDARGEVIFPAQVWLSYAGCSPPAHLSPDASLCIEDQQFINKLEVGNVLGFFDVRGRKTSLRISKKFSVFTGYGYIAECSRTAYIGSGTELHIKGKKNRLPIGRVVNVPASEKFIRLKVGDLLTISRDPCLYLNESGGSAFSAARITCSSGRLFDSVKPGEPIAFDDGRIWGVIQGTSINEIIVSITHASLKGSKLGSEKSINIPKSEMMRFEGLTSKDLVDLDFVTTNADMVGISFIRNVHDVIVVQRELEKRKLRKLGLVLKIETEAAFENLPLLLLQAMQSPNPLGVMIARGDLAVECGWDNMAGYQEEMLSMCNAAHIPVIWATQVLESLVKSGIPTRAEITDVATGMRADCIMLNKGKHLIEAVATLDSILCSRTSKKNLKALLKPLFLSCCPNQ